MEISGTKKNMILNKYLAQKRTKSVISSKNLIITMGDVSVVLFDEKRTR